MLFSNKHAVIYLQDCLSLNSSNASLLIFSLKGRIKTYLYKAKIFFDDTPNNRGFDVKKAFVYECRNGSATDIVLIKEMDIRKKFGDFSLLQFMKDVAHGKSYRYPDCGNS